jgi:DNA invertase Pin-like site-specific DNA recombinase
VKPLRAWLYARVSTTKESQDNSGPRQLEQLAARAAQRGWQVVGDGTDRLSGRNMDRPELQRALDALRERRADVLMVARLSRLGRNLEDVIAAGKQIGDWGAHLFVADLGIDTTAGQMSTAQRLIFNVIAACDQAVRDFQVDAIQSGLARARAKGKRLGRRPVVLLYEVKDRARRLHAQGVPWRKIRARMVAMGFNGLPSHASLRRAVLAMDKIPPKGSAPNPAEEDPPLAVREHLFGIK